MTQTSRKDEQHGKHQKESQKNIQFTPAPISPRPSRDSGLTTLPHHRARYVRTARLGNGPDGLNDSPQCLHRLQLFVSSRNRWKLRTPANRPQCLAARSCGAEHHALLSLLTLETAIFLKRN